MAMAEQEELAWSGSDASGEGGRPYSPNRAGSFYPARFVGVAPVAEKVDFTAI
jgi:hypothetical protein